jgi:hypothetical protein
MPPAALPTRVNGYQNTHRSSAPPIQKRRWAARSLSGIRVVDKAGDKTSGVPLLRPEEEWVRQVVASTIGTVVRQHDDQSRAGMYDLSIEYPSGDLAALEVTAAADGESLALWNLLNGTRGRWIDPAIVGGWMVSLYPTARAKVLRTRLPVLLLELERVGRRELRPNRLNRSDRISVEATALGVAHAYQGGTDYPGSIYTTIELPTERSGGFVANTGDALADWLGDFLVHEDRQDVREKLRASKLSERHVFVILPGFAAVEFSVMDLLMRDDAPLPSRMPQLPAEVTHAWIASTWSTGSGMRWAPDTGWSYFNKTVE